MVTIGRIFYARAEIAAPAQGDKSLWFPTTAWENDAIKAPGGAVRIVGHDRRAVGGLGGHVFQSGHAVSPMDDLYCTL